MDALREAEDWLYDEGDAEVASVFRSKLSGLKQTGEPMKQRALVSSGERSKRAGGGGKC